MELAKPAHCDPTIQRFIGKLALHRANRRRKGAMVYPQRGLDGAQIRLAVNEPVLSTPSTPSTPSTLSIHGAQPSFVARDPSSSRESQACDCAICSMRSAVWRFGGCRVLIHAWPQQLSFTSLIWLSAFNLEVRLGDIDAYPS